MVTRTTRPWRRAFGVAATLSIVGALAWMPSCGPGFLDGISDGVPLAEGGAGGELEASAVTEGGAPDGRACNSALAPERSGDIDVPSTTDLRLLFAIEALRIDGEEGVTDAGVGPARGLDLDRTCTCPEPESCNRPESDRRCDGPNGTDNALGTFFTLLGLSVKDLPNGFATDRIRRGNFTVLVEVLGWNGTPNDPSVVVSLRMSQQLDNSEPDAAPRDKPLFDGTDVWTVEPGSIAQGGGEVGEDCRDPKVICAARIRDDNAFVRDGKLVARPRIDNGQNVPIVIRVGAGRIVIDLIDTTLLGTLVPAAGGGYRLEGELSGRWPERGVLNAAASLEPLGRPGSHVCEDDAGYATVKSILCKTLDLAGESARDRRGDRCSAASAALAFSAGKAGVGHILRKDTVESPCADWQDDCSK